ncbi:MAG: outer membrane lipid asymmetry maintenance protein MlaD [Gammaproteobacteria bacterium]
MKKTSLEMIVGAFLLAGFASFAYLAVKMGDLDLFKEESYAVTARFTSISGLKEGAMLELAGVNVGKVTKIELDAGEYEAIVHMDINKTIQLTDDSIASIRTSGIIGDKFIKLTPGGSEIFLESGDVIEETEASISLEELVSKYIFEGE